MIPKDLHDCLESVMLVFCSFSDCVCSPFIINIPFVILNLYKFFICWDINKIHSNHTSYYCSETENCLILCPSIIRPICLLSYLFCRSPRAGWAIGAIYCFLFPILLSSDTYSITMVALEHRELFNSESYFCLSDQYASSHICFVDPVEQLVQSIAFFSQYSYHVTLSSQGLVSYITHSSITTWSIWLSGWGHNLKIKGSGVQFPLLVLLSENCLILRPSITRPICRLPYLFCGSPRTGWAIGAIYCFLFPILLSCDTAISRAPGLVSYITRNSTTIRAHGWEDFKIKRSGVQFPLLVTLVLSQVNGLRQCWVPGGSKINLCLSGSSHVCPILPKLIRGWFLAKALILFPHTKWDLWRCQLQRLRARNICMELVIKHVRDEQLHSCSAWMFFSNYRRL